MQQQQFTNATWNIYKYIIIIKKDELNKPLLNH